MYSNQQESLFFLSDLLEMSPKDTYGYLFETRLIKDFILPLWSACLDLDIYH